MPRSKAKIDFINDPKKRSCYVTKRKLGLRKLINAFSTITSMYAQFIENPPTLESECEMTEDSNKKPTLGIHKRLEKKGRRVDFFQKIMEPQFGMGSLSKVDSTSQIADPILPSEDPQISERDKSFEILPYSYDHEQNFPYEKYVEDITEKWKINEQNPWDLNYIYGERSPISRNIMDSFEYDGVFIDENQLQYQNDFLMNQIIFFDS